MCQVCDHVKSLPGTKEEQFSHIIKEAIAECTRLVKEKPCFYCGTEVTIMAYDTNSIYVECRGCGHQSSFISLSLYARAKGLSFANHKNKVESAHLCPTPIDPSLN